jgi:hypothetical protein
MTTNDEIKFDESDLISLGQKLASLDLTEPERSALGALISDDDVIGFGRFDLLGGVRIGLRKGGSPLGKRFNVRVPGLRANPLIGDDLPKPGRF